MELEQRPERRRRTLQTLRQECEGLTATVVHLRADMLAGLIDVAKHATDVMTTTHEGFREDIDFIPLWRSLVELGLMPYDPADWDDDVTGPPPKLPS